MATATSRAAHVGAAFLSRRLAVSRNHADLATAMHTNCRTVVRWEGGHSVPSLESVAKLDGLAAPGLEESERTAFTWLVSKAASLKEYVVECERLGLTSLHSAHKDAGEPFRDFAQQLRRLSANECYFAASYLLGLMRDYFLFPLDRSKLDVKELTKRLPEYVTACTGYRFFYLAECLCLFWDKLVPRFAEDRAFDVQAARGLSELFLGVVRRIRDPEQSFGAFEVQLELFSSHISLNNSENIHPGIFNHRDIGRKSDELRSLAIELAIELNRTLANAIMFGPNEILEHHHQAFHGQKSLYFARYYSWFLESDLLEMAPGRLQAVDSSTRFFKDINAVYLGRFHRDRGLISLRDQSLQFGGKRNPRDIHRTLGDVTTGVIASAQCRIFGELSVPDALDVIDPIYRELAKNSREQAQRSIGYHIDLINEFLPGRGGKRPKRGLAG